MPVRVVVREHDALARERRDVFRPLLGLWVVHAAVVEAEVVLQYGNNMRARRAGRGAGTRARRAGHPRARARAIRRGHRDNRRQQGRGQDRSRIYQRHGYIPTGETVWWRCNTPTRSQQDVGVRERYARR